MPPTVGFADAPSSPHASTRSDDVSPPTTPTHDQAMKQPAAITREQKQGLIDNLQLEVTERARKLRAQYALQAQGLRTRIEMRINRIPAAIRKMTMGELLAKHDAEEASRAFKTAAAKAATANPVMKPAVKPAPVPAPKTQVNVEKPKKEEEAEAALPRTRGTKRASDEMKDANADQENVPHADLPNPKKRTKASTTAKTTTTTTTTKAKTTAAAAAKSRVTSRAKTQPSQGKIQPSQAKFQPSQVLSPKSHNSRTIHHSPIRPVAPSISQPNVARTVSAATTGTVITKSRATRTKAVGPTGVSATTKTTATKSTTVKGTTTKGATTKGTVASAAVKKRVSKPKAEPAPVPSKRVLRKRP
ncbi:MAG: hypothetical protein M1823_002664 [Watsoniomyces obsoletus]|nr:MAG: hypothetical protein M1823_002664 [Watsoniomyces obsoletus]